MANKPQRTKMSNDYKRGEIIEVQGRKFKYIKMVKGNWALRSFPDNKPYQLNKAGFLIPM